MIYIVTSGIYSDYHIITATTDRESAEKIAEHFGADIEEFENATTKALEIKQHKYLFTHEGVLKGYNVFETNEYSISYESNVHKNSSIEWIVDVYTDKPKEVADKIAYDLLAEARAKEEGI